MSQQTETADISPDRRSEGFSAFWWLGLPLLVAVGLALLALYSPGFYSDWIGADELGLLEQSEIFVPLAALVFAIRILIMPELRGRAFLYFWVGAAALGTFYIAGEEASWGQHYLRWATPEAWQAINDQAETNLHNVSSWLDQKPRSLLELGVIVGGIVIPILALFRPTLRSGRFAIILPPMLCLPSALLAEITRLTERLPEAFGGSSAVFPRASEIQELFFYIFLLFYLIVLRQRIASGLYAKDGSLSAAVASKA